MTCDLHWISLDQQSSAVLKAQQRIETATELQSTCYLLSPTHGDQSCSPAAHVITGRHSNESVRASSWSSYKMCSLKYPTKKSPIFWQLLHLCIYLSIHPTNQPSYSILSYPILSIQVNKYHFDQHVFDIFWGDSLGPACRDAPRVKDISAISSLQRWQAPTWRCWGSMIMNWGISYYIQ